MKTVPVIGPLLASFRQSKWRVHIMLILAASCTLLMMGINEMVNRNVILQLRVIQQFHDLRDNIHNTLRAMTSAESAQRGYVLTGDRKYLQEYKESLTQIPDRLGKLDVGIAIMNDEADELARSFGIVTRQRIDEMALVVRLREGDKLDAVSFIVNSDVGYDQMKALRATGEALMKSIGKDIISSREDIHWQLNISRLGVAACALAAFLAFLQYIRQLMRLEKLSVEHLETLNTERDALEAQVLDRTTRLSELANYLQQATESERAHLARELHDELGALLTAAKLDVARIKSRLPSAGPELTERLTHLTSTLNEGIALKRRIIEDLRPSSLSNLGLVASLEILAREFADRSGLHIETVLEPVEVDEQSQLTIYRLVQEALTNIGKYAQARTVCITLKNYVHHVEVSVTDDGLGFDPKHLPRASHGLVGMRHRIEANGGRLDINSQSGHGTRIVGTVPNTSKKPQSQLAVSLAATAVSAPSYAVSTPSPTPLQAKG